MTFEANVDIFSESRNSNNLESFWNISSMCSSAEEIY